MTKSELIEKLKDFPDDVEVIIVADVWQSGGCSCGEYCYCSSEATEFYISQIDKKVMPSKDKKNKKMDVVSAVLRVEKN